MALKDTISALRHEQGITQEQLAERLSVTRQAVSRWENGDTSPDIETLKLIAAALGVPVERVLELPSAVACQSCGMPLADASLLGTEADGALAEHFCKWCYTDGSYADPSMTMEQMVDVCVPNMTGPESPFTEEQARAYLNELLPTLDRWK